MGVPHRASATQENIFFLRPTHIHPHTRKNKHPALFSLIKYHFELQLPLTKNFLCFIKQGIQSSTQSDFQIGKFEIIISMFLPCIPYFFQLVHVSSSIFMYLFLSQFIFSFIERKKIMARKRYADSS
jgi:hypothetical protein